VDWTNGKTFPAGPTNSSLLHTVQTSYGSHPACNTMVTGGSFLDGKAARREDDHSLPSVAVVKNCGVIPPLVILHSLKR
jgi:hypothetical protein